MTSEVMAVMTPRLQSPGMKRLVRIAALLFLLLAFGAFSVDVVARQGAHGLAHVLGREPWAAQIMIDLCVCAVFAGAWLRRDARERGIASLPYLVAIPLVGSLSVLVYLVRRELAAGAGPVTSASARAGSRAAS